MSSWVLVLVAWRNAKRYEKKDAKPGKEEKPKPNKRKPDTDGVDPPSAKQPKRHPKKWETHETHKI